jgi:hypothetical protein
MADAPEIPEVNDPFGKRVALTIAVLAVALSLVTTVGDNAKSDALLAATRAANNWAFYQAKSIKEHSFDTDREILEAEIADSGSARSGKRAALAARYGGEVGRYQREKDDIKKKAEELEAEVIANGEVNDRCDLGALLLQVGIVLGSVAILVRWKAFWIASIVVGASGIVAATGVVPLP